MIKLSNQHCSVDIDLEHGGRIAQIQIDGMDLLVKQEQYTSNPLAWGSYPMVPWVGRLRDGKFIYQHKTYSFPLNMPPHAIHGTCFDKAWQLDDLSDSQIVLSTSLGNTWPFAGYSKQIISLNENSLKLELSVHTEKENFPASLGWHPWFMKQLSRGESAQLNFTANKKYACDETQIPTDLFVEQGQSPWDDCFIEVQGTPAITWPYALKLDIESNCDHWVVYDMPEHALCVEPQTAAANALNNSAFIVTPEKPLCAETTLRWQLL